MKVACTVWTGGKDGDAIKVLPIGIVYGIAVTAMSFFVNPTISAMTSGRLSQNIDLGGLSFPRRFGVRFHVDYMKKYGFLGMQACWDGFEDKKFKHCLGKDFHHEDMISREGWAMYYFNGKFARDVGYIRLQILNPTTGMLIHTFYFEFKKSYQLSLDARYYVTDPILDEKIVKNGFLTELLPGKTASGEVRYKKAKSTFKQTKKTDIMLGPKRAKTVEVDTPVIVQTQVRYSEKPKMIFLVTPPHLAQYAKLILILISQLVNLNFDKSYMTKTSQKPCVFCFLISINR